LLHASNTCILYAIDYGTERALPIHNHVIDINFILREILVLSFLHAFHYGKFVNTSG